MLQVVEHDCPPSDAMTYQLTTALQEIAAVEPPVLRTLDCLLWARARSGRYMVAQRAF